MVDAELDLQDRVQAAIRNTLDSSKYEARVFSHSNNDIDVVVVIPDGSSAIGIIETLSPPLLRLSIELQALITFTPIEKLEFESSQSGFLRNVRSEATHAPKK